MTSEIANSIDAVFGTALDHHRNGRLAEAEHGYRATLEHAPNHADALHYLGVLIHQKGDPREAEDLLRRAVAVNPENPNFQNNLGTVLMTSGRVRDAAPRFEAAITLDSDFAQAHSNLGACLHQLDRLAEAERAARTAVRLQPQVPDALFNLGNILMARGRPEEALSRATAAVALQPGHALANALAGSALFTLGRAGEALGYFNRAADLSPTDPVIQMNWGNALLDVGQLEAAILACRRALEINPNLAVAHAVMGNALKQQGLITEAEDSYQKATTADPKLASAGSDLLFAFQYDPTRTPGETLAHARAWNTAFAMPSSDLPDSRNDAVPSIHAPLRVGYVSADLRAHSVGYFMAALLKHHDPNTIEVFCYANSAIEDGQTKEFKSWAPHWSNITALDDDRAADLIRGDGIDILVDLSGHTGGNRLPLFARRPAPLQVTYLGFPATTGLDEIDYRLTDAIADPEGSGERDYSETLIHLPRGFLCYTPPSDAPEPEREAGPLTFGSFNNVPKINDTVIAAWTRILHAVPNALLMLKHRSFSDPSTCRRHGQMFARAGIDPNRITMTGFVDSTNGHLAAYNKIDVALDTFPYNGTTTTAEALWMGVPVIAVSGDRHASRVGASILTHAGLPELIVRDLDHYVALAVDLARNPAKLSAYRSGLRSTLERSRFLDGPGFTHALEDTYRRLWRRLCGDAGTGTGTSV